MSILFARRKSLSEAVIIFCRCAHLPKLPASSDGDVPPVESYRAMEARIQEEDSAANPFQWRPSLSQLTQLGFSLLFWWKFTR